MPIPGLAFRGPVSSPRASWDLNFRDITLQLTVPVEPTFLIGIGVKPS